MTTPTVLAKDDSTKIVELAAQEGHDADIPSNAGFVHHEKSQAILEESNHPLDKDIEKEAGKGASTPASLAGASFSSASEKQQNISPPDPNIVGWDGDDDPQNPMNWSPFLKWGAIAIVSGVTFLTPFGSAICAPGIPQIMDEFNSTSELLSGFIVSVYVLGFALGPLGMREDPMLQSNLSC
jgi:hypothetical protein